MRQINVAKTTESNSTELLFYRFINALAYSKFADFIVADVEEKTQDKNVKTVKDFYQDFTENETEFSNMFGKELHQKIVLIIDEFCQEKFGGGDYGHNDQFTGVYGRCLQYLFKVGH